MAKWGEGDPRWIVEERADATNVNNWHWTEKQAGNWSKEKIKSLLAGFVIEDDCYFCEIKEVSKLDGDASASNRKAKLIFFYEWEIKGEWKGKMKSSGTSFKGEFEVPNLSDENEIDEVDVSVSVKNDGDEAYKVKEFMRIHGSEKIREQLGRYIKDLREEYTQGMILPAKNGNGSKPQTTAPKAQQNCAKQEMSAPILSAVKNMGLGVQIKCKKLTGKSEFKCRSAELYRALTDRSMVCAFSQSDAEVDAMKGGRFSMFGGNITGEFTDLETNERIEMKWRFKSWPAEHYSQVKLKLEEKDDCTVLNLTQTGVPETDYDRTKEGWERYYWQAIKATFGYGASLF